MIPGSHDQGHVHYDSSGRGRVDVDGIQNAKEVIGGAQEQLDIKSSLLKQR